MGRKARPLNDLVLMARRLMGWTQSRMADKTYINQPHICDMENHHRPVSETKMNAIARATKCSFWIFGRGSCLLDPDETKEMGEWLDEEIDVGKVQQNRKRKKK